MMCPHKTTYLQCMSTRVVIAGEQGNFLDPRPKISKEGLILLENPGLLKTLSMVDLFDCLQLSLVFDPLLGFRDLTL